MSNDDVAVMLMRELPKITKQLEDRLDKAEQSIRGDLKESVRETRSDMKEIDSRIVSLSQAVTEIRGVMSTRIEHHGKTITKLQEHDTELFKKSNKLMTNMNVLVAKVNDHCSDPNIHAGHLRHPDQLKQVTKMHDSDYWTRIIGGGGLGMAGLGGLIYLLIVEILPRMP